MNKLTLTRLSVKSFKGIPFFAMTIDGLNTAIFGDNATGKTTLFDSFVYLLFDKDSQNKKDFSLKTLDSSGKERHGLEHEVEAEFNFNGKSLTLRKVFQEKWIKKRGSATSEFTGHTTDYYVDGVPVKKGEYQKNIESIVNEDIFKLLTSPSYFNEQVKWQDRRKILLEICGDISDEEVISGNQSLSVLPTILQGRTIENHRKIIAARRAEINKELDKIPVRIDEIQRSLPEMDGLEKEQIETEITKFEDAIDEKLTLINNIRNGNAISSKQHEIQQVEMDMLKIKQAHQESSNDKSYSLKTRIQEEKSNVSILQSKAGSHQHRKEMNAFSMKQLEESMKRLREEWQEVNKQEFVHESDCNCPTCGQSLPEEQVQSVKDKALTAFNKSKAERLESIKANGKQSKAKLDEMKVADAEIDKEIQKLATQISDKNELISKLLNQLTSIESTIIEITDVPEYAEKINKKNSLVTEIRELREESEQAIQSINSEVYELKQKRDQLQGEIGKFIAFEQSKQRISDLMKQERTLASEFEKLEQELYLTEEFIRTKVELLEEKINSKFQYARFKLFEQQINGGLTEVCETLFQGVPYSSGLNNAAKINVGLDIINTLSEYYGFSAPIWIDNAEAVTKLIDISAQTISLIVSEPDKQLRVEKIETKIEEEIV